MAGFGQLLGALILERREAGGFTQIELAEQAFPDLKDHEGKERRIRELELGDVTRPQARNYQPICDVLNITREDIRALKARAADGKAQNDSEFTEVIEDKGSVDAALSDAAALTRDQLELLASRFEIETPHKLSEAQLQQLLTQKAEEYRSYRDQIDALDDRISAVHNLKGAAQEAADRLDFDAVEDILARVDLVETVIMAETKEARAANALLRGRADDAYAIYTAAAESFRQLDVTEMARRRNTYFEDLYNHGLRYGGTGLPRAIDMIRPAIDALKDSTHKTDWAAYTQNLATALQFQGTRTDGTAGTALQAEAVTAYRIAITVFTKADHPVEWAQTTQNLANTLANQGTRTDGPTGTALLAQAVTAFRDALTIRTKADHPMQWATTTQNLAIALEARGTRTDGPAGTGLLAQAVTAYRDALTIRTQADHPVDWAETTQNLAGALQIQGTRTVGPAGTALLAQAVTAYRDALTITTKADHPVHWAMTTENIALAEESIADHAATDDPRPHLESALTYVDAALEVYDPDQMSFDHARATKHRARILAKLNAL